MGPIERSDVVEPLFEVAKLPFGSEHLEVCREAVRRADLMGDDDLRFKARLFLICSATFGGFPEVAVVEMGWCIGHVSENHRVPLDAFQVPLKPDTSFRTLSCSGLLWSLKWVLGSLYQFPRIRRHQIEASFEQARELYSRRGLNFHALHGLHALSAYELGDLEIADRYREDWLRTPRDEGSDCLACEKQKEVTFLLWDRHYARAVEIAAPLIEGRLRCDGEPSMVPGLLLPLVRVNRLDEAATLHRRGIRMDLSAPRRHVGGVHCQVRFLTATGNYERASSVIRRFTPFALSAVAADVRLDFLSAWNDLLHASRTRTGKRTFEGPLPGAVSVSNKAGRYRVVDLERWLTMEVNRLAAAFDARNGNRWTSARVAARQKETLALLSAYPIEPLSEVDEQ